MPDECKEAAEGGEGDGRWGGGRPTVSWWPRPRPGRVSVAGGRRRRFASCGGFAGMLAVGRAGNPGRARRAGRGGRGRGGGQLECGCLLLAGSGWVARGRGRRAGESRAVSRPPRLGGALGPPAVAAPLQVGHEVRPLPLGHSAEARGSFVCCGDRLSLGGQDAEPWGGSILAGQGSAYPEFPPNRSPRARTRQIGTPPRLARALRPQAWPTSVSIDRNQPGLGRTRPGLCRNPRQSAGVVGKRVCLLDGPGEQTPRYGRGTHLRNRGCRAALS